MSNVIRKDQLHADELFKPLVVTGLRDAVSKNEGFLVCTARGRQIRFSGGGKVPDHLKAALEHVASFDGLPPNWNSYGAPAIEDRVVDAAIGMLLEGFRFCEIPRVTPANNGGIDLAWERDERSLEITVGPDLRGEVLFTDPDSDEDIEEINVPLPRAKQRIRQFCAHR